MTVHKSLTYLDISMMRIQVTDAGMKELASLKALTHLNLAFTGVTDAGLKELAALKGLTEIELDEYGGDGRRGEEIQAGTPQMQGHSLIRG